MKHSVYLFFGLLVFFTACKSVDTPGEDVSVMPSNPSSQLLIGYHKNVETMALLYNLSVAGDIQFESNPAPRAMLARKLTEKFADFKDHEGVKQVSFLVNEGFVDLYDIDLSLYFTEFPEFEQYADFPSIYYEHDSLSPEEVQAVFDRANSAIRQFYLDAELETFFEQEGKSLFEKLQQEVMAVAPDKGYIQLMEDYYGIRRNSYHIVVSAFSFNGIGRSKTIETAEGMNIYQLVTSNPEDESEEIDLEDLDSFTIGYTDPEYFQEIAVHELGHSFFYEILREDTAIITQVDHLAYLFSDSLQTAMRNQGYMDWRMCFEEHLVRLGEIKMAELMGKDTFAIEYRKRCIQKRGFRYLPELEEILKDYESDRMAYPTIREFLPIAIERLDKRTRFAFLQGTWKKENEEQYEAWESNGAYGLKGYSFSIKDDQKTTTETLVIRKTDDKWIYKATVPDQNEGKTIPFTLNPEVDSLFSFENLQHDFPQKIQYKRIDPEHIQVRVLGAEDSGFSFLQIRQGE